MGQAKLKRAMMQNGNPMVTDKGQYGTAVDAPPPSNTGGKSEHTISGESDRTVTDRLRINLSVPAGVRDALAGAAEKTGMSIAQAALAALVAGLPALQSQVDAVRGLKS